MLGRRGKLPRPRCGRSKKMSKAPTTHTGMLLEALEPFAKVELPGSGQEGECVWLYVGQENPYTIDGPDCGHLRVEDFRRARRAMRHHS